MIAILDSTNLSSKWLSGVRSFIYSLDESNLLYLRRLYVTIFHSVATKFTKQGICQASFLSKGSVVAEKWLNKGFRLNLVLWRFGSYCLGGFRGWQRTPKVTWPGSRKQQKKNIIMIIIHYKEGSEFQCKSILACICYQLSYFLLFIKWE